MATYLSPANKTIKYVPVRCAQPNIGHNTGVNGEGRIRLYLLICSSTVGKLGRLSTAIPNIDGTVTTTIMSQQPNTNNFFEGRSYFRTIQVGT